MISIFDGWRLFIKAFSSSMRGDVGLAAEWMYRLNVFARSVGRVPVSEQIYDIKNVLIKYLYQNGYATEVKMHKQEFECWGSYMYGCGKDCEKCGGTGVYRTVKLYSFRFLVKGVHYSWHQPFSLVDYTVVTFSNDSGDEDEKIFDSSTLKRDEAILNVHDAWFGCCVIWWTLAFRGVNAPLILWRSTKNMLMKKSGLLKVVNGFKKIRADMREARARIKWSKEYPVDYDFDENYPF